MRVSWPELTREELLARLQKAVAALAECLPLERVVLFGSWVSGRATVASDVDALVVYADPPREDAFRIVWQALVAAGVPRPEPHVYAASEAARLAPTLAAMTRCGIVLFPAEGTGQSDSPVE
ncbi:nucleotidyltransferase domain-containing protein [Thermomicrobium sp. 4228-Ro]|uniref:nucleotidyltransferase domain-containing protein n=1 Tax=Thermomicrobium sp. 4228-Ro TaxID=2993937 RepID=UPI002249962E|nr:nucleotidyltransferase domain-containing protein [Thermomicrobium sp. 4228-Ro]MCX2727933.1 nucleotidyltransferase domain-containing protein [Thermomicrobium sp. 4228-Ro]